jgi:hypothetical protein
MKPPFRVLCLPLLATIVGCATARVTSDWDRDANFAAYKTFAWAENPQMRALQQNSLFDKRLRAAVDRQLAAKGLREVETGADVLVAYHAGISEKVDLQETGRFGRNLNVRQYREGTLVLDIVDGRSKQLVWRGSAAGEMNRSDGSAERLDKAVAKMLAEFPPKP